MAQILAIYYSLTFQTEAVMRAVTDALVRQGHQVTLEPIRLADPYPLPAPPQMLLELLKAASTGAWPIKALIPPTAALDAPYDLVLIGYQPWFMTPSVPVHSFLRSEYAEVLRNRPVIGLVTCRALYERAGGLFQRWVEERGGEVIEQAVWQDQDTKPTNFVSLLHMLKHGHDYYKAPLNRVLKRFGVGDRGLARATAYGENLAGRLHAGPLAGVGELRRV